MLVNGLTAVELAQKPYRAHARYREERQRQQCAHGESRPPGGLRVGAVKMCLGRGCQLSQTGVPAGAPVASCEVPVGESLKDVCWRPWIVDLVQAGAAWS